MSKKTYGIIVSVASVVCQTTAALLGIFKPSMYGAWISVTEVVQVAIVDALLPFVKVQE